MRDARTQVADRISAAAGMDLRMLDASRLQWVIETRCRALGIADADAYAKLLAREPGETDALIEQTIVPETRFFRDAAVFHHLQQWAASTPGRLRVLSAPCSTGQEAYSLAATLQLTGRQDAMVTAIDLSAAALKTAEMGAYPEEALRDLTLEQRNACGYSEGKQWKMHAALRQQIRFERRNLAEPGVLGEEQFHLILCRNLFIYLKPEARLALAESLAAALLPGGRLVLGTADHCEELSALFSPLKPAAAFAHTHRAQVEEAKVPSISKETAVGLLQHRPGAPAAPEAAAKSPSAAALHRVALELEAEGDLQRAEHRCRQALYVDPGLLPALELLEKLWRNLPDQRLRRALAARIERNRPIERKRAEATVEGTS